MERPRLSISTISTDSGGSAEDPCSIDVDGSVSIPQVEQGNVAVGPIVVHQGGTGVLNGNLNSYILNQYIVSTGEEFNPEAVKDLVTDAVKFSTDTKEQFFPKDDVGYSKTTGSKEDLKGLQRRWCVLILVLVALSFCILLSTSLFSLSTSRGNETPQTPLLEYQSDVLGSDIKGAPRMMSRNFWIAQPPAGPLDENSLPAKMLIVLHTATEPCFTTGDCIRAVRYIQQFHVDSLKFADIGYNFLIGGDGSVYVGRGWDKMGAHTIHYNKGTLGVAFVGLFSHILPNEAQIEAFNKLASLAVKLGKLSPDYTLVAQCQLRTTAAPGGALVQNMTSWPHFNSSLPLTGCTDLEKE